MRNKMTTLMAGWEVALTHVYGYFVSSEGEVGRMVTEPAIVEDRGAQIAYNHLEPVPAFPSEKFGGNLAVSLARGDGTPEGRSGPEKLYRVDKLVARAFMGVSGRFTVVHIDGDPYNCALDNLEITKKTPQQEIIQPWQPKLGHTRRK
jgi:hypothetical protein